MEVTSFSIHNPLRLCYGRRTAFPLASSQLFYVHKGLHVGHTSIKQIILRNSNSSALNGSSCIPRKHMGIQWTCFQEQFNWPDFGYKLYKRNKLQRHIVVRSELVGNGIPYSAYPLSETKLGSKVRGMCFYAITAIAAIFFIVPMLLQHPFVLLLDQYRRNAQFLIARIWATLTLAPFLKIKYVGLENLPSPDAPAVYVSNHQSFLDIYTLLTVGRSFKFISKTGIFLFPIIGWAMFLLGVIPLKRMDSRSQLECLKRCTELVKKGASVFVFPEGTRSKDGKLSTFKKGAFSIAAKTRVPVVPITLVGTGKIMPVGMEGIVNSGSVTVVIHKPVEGSNPEVLCNEVRNTIANALDQQS